MRSAKRVEGRLPGGSRSLLVWDDQHLLWVLKFRHNPQHSRLLINELLANLLARAIGLTVPDCALVRVSPDFLQQLPEAAFRYENGRAPYTPGLHFGSRYVLPSYEPACWSSLWPRADTVQFTNAEEIAGVLAFDAWVDNTDRRQAVFVPAERRSRKLTAFWIDNGSCFGDQTWDPRFLGRQNLLGRNPVYPTIAKWDDFDPWLTQIEQFPLESMWRTALSIPIEWTSDDVGDLSRLIEVLLIRRKRLRHLLADVILRHKQIFTAWPSNTRVRVFPSVPSLVADNSSTAGARHIAP